MSIRTMIAAGLSVAVLPVVAEADSAKNVFARVSGSVVVVLASGVGGQGSGVAVSRNQVVTNCHVVSRATEIAVRQALGKPGRQTYRMAARLATRDNERDLCLLSVKDSSDYPALKPVPLGKARDVSVGEDVYAVGAPRGFELSISRGIVSQLRDASRTASAPIIQTDAALSPGSSGGGLFNRSGELIGITTFKVSDTGSEGLSFAVPVEWVKELLATEQKWLTCASSPTVTCVISQALEMAENVVHPKHRDSILHAIALAQAATENVVGALKTAGQMTDAFLLASALLDIAQAQAGDGDDTESHETLARALQVTERIDDRLSLALLLSNIARQQTISNATGSNATFSEALRVADQFNSPTLRSIVLTTVAKQQAQVGNIENAWKAAERIGGGPNFASAVSSIAQAQAETGKLTIALQTARRIDTEFSMVLALKSIAQRKAMAGDDKGARDTFAEAIQVAEQIRARYSHAWSLTGIARAQASAGDGTEAAKTLGKALRATNEIKSVALRARALSGIAEAQSKMSDHASSRKTLAHAHRMASQVLDVEKRASILRRIVRVQAEAGDTSEALRNAREIDHPSMPAVALAEVAVAIGNPK